MATGSARSVVLEDLTVCEAVPHDLLSTTLDYHVRSYWVRHTHRHYENPDRWVSSYNCNLLSSSDGPFDILQLSYGVGTAHLFGESRAHVPIGEFSSRYPEAEPVVLEGHEGQGWTITLANAAYVVWEYPDGYVLSVRLTTPEGAPSAEDTERLLLVVREVVDVIPPVAAGPDRVGTEVTVDGVEVDEHESPKPSTSAATAPATP